MTTIGRLTFDEAVDYLTEHLGEIRGAWNNPSNHIAGCLFQYAGGSGCGCLTQVRCGNRAATPELAARIRADERIPTLVTEITVASLPVFAEWQRILDKELGRQAQ